MYQGSSQGCQSWMHVYSETSARAALTRSRIRGGEIRTMFHCPYDDHWHVIEGTLDQQVH